jgi:hypothetical protein
MQDLLQLQHQPFCFMALGSYYSIKIQGGILG